MVSLRLVNCICAMTVQKNECTYLSCSIKALRERPLHAGADAWIAVDNIPSNKVIDESDGAPTFAWVPQGATNDTELRGWEGYTNYFTSPGTYTIQAKISYQPQAGGIGTVGTEEIPVEIDCSTVPVTVGYFHSAASGDAVDFYWQTATETSNAGFNLYAETDGGLVSSTIA